MIKYELEPILVRISVVLMRLYLLIVVACFCEEGICRDEEKILKACYWANEVYEPCFGGCAEVSCDNPRNHLRPCYPYCEPGCVCEDPYVRDDRTHQCVLPQDCSPTQMGIPVPTKRSSKLGQSKNTSRMQRSNSKREEGIPDNDRPNDRMDTRRAAEVSRMGNYFNIVIAPPPIKPLQPRKTLNNVVRMPEKQTQY